MKILVTGGAGFIGSAVVRYLLQGTGDEVINLDKLTYAGNLHNLDDVVGHPRYAFERVDICDRAGVDRVFREHRPEAVLHLAAESHVDRSIDGPAAFVETNVTGTFVLLEAARDHWSAGGRPAGFRFQHVSTDEVYGSLGPDGRFAETSRYRPSSPYAASKASADHFVRAWGKTYGLPVLVTNCSNNYGPYQFPEKLIPLMILKALEGEPLPVYGRGENVRDWLYVDDHARALREVLGRGSPGSTYNIGGDSERSNIDVVRSLCSILDELAPAANGRPHADGITFVADRPGHDYRYAIDAGKIERELGWRPRETFESGLRKTVAWYLSHRSWVEAVRDGSYRGERLGLESD